MLKTLKKAALAFMATAICVCVIPNTVKANSSTTELIVQRDVYSYSMLVEKNVAYADALIQVVNGGFPTTYYQISAHLCPENAYTTWATLGCTFTYNTTKYASYLSGYGSLRFKYMLAARLNPSAGYSSITATFHFEP